MMFKKDTERFPNPVVSRLDHRSTTMTYPLENIVEFTR